MICHHLICGRLFRANQPWKRFVRYPAVLMPPANEEPVVIQSMETTELHRAVHGRLPLKPWFGSSNLLAYTLAGESGRWIVTGTDMGKYTTDLVDPEPALGFDVTVGSYLACGRFGLGITYTNWNPEAETVIRTGNSGMIYSAMPTYNDISVDPGTGLDTLYDHIDGSATGVRTIRNVSFQGLEVNLSCFGLMGARRISRDCCPRGCFGHGLGLHSHCHGYGGLTGPLVRPCGGRVRIVNSHGIRWFQAKDYMEFAYNIDGTNGYQADDIPENIEVENNLYGYRFGTGLLLNSCWNFTVGRKVGLYANDAVEASCRDGDRVGLHQRESNGRHLHRFSDTSLAICVNSTSVWGIASDVPGPSREAIGCLAWLVLPLPSTRFHRAIQRSPQVERSTLTTATFCTVAISGGMQLVDGVLIDHPKEFPVRSDSIVSWHDFTVSWQ